MRRSIGATALTTVALAIAGCGGDGDDGDGGATDANQQVIEGAEAAATSEQDVAAAFAEQLNAHPDPAGIAVSEYQLPDEPDPCTLLQVLVGPDQIALYSEDPVVTNPDGTIGAHITATTAGLPGCLRAAEGVLAGL